MSLQAPLHDNVAGFASIISIYEHRVGHACRAVAKHIPPLLHGLPSSPVVHDNACGTGAVTEQLLKAIPATKIYATDAIPGMVMAMKSIVAVDPALQAAVAEVEIMNGEELTYPDDTFDASVMNFGIFFFPNSVLGAQQIHRTLKPGGIAVFTLWAAFGFKPVLWAVQEVIKPANPLEELPLMEPWCDGTLLEKTLKEGGFESVEMTTVTEGMWGEDRKDFESVLLENFSAMVHSNWSDEEKARLPQATTQVLDEREKQFCIYDGKKIGVPMKAWIAVCRK